MDKRKIALALGVVIVVVLVWALQPSLLLLRSEAPMSQFQERLEESDCVNIVEVLGSNDRNVMQCAVDYSLDLGALGKDVRVVAFSPEEGCLTENGPSLSQLCTLSLLFSSCPTIYITGEGEPNSYNNLLKVVVGESYDRGECSVLVNGIPAYEYIVSQLANNTTNATAENQSVEVESTDGESTPPQPA